MLEEIGFYTLSDYRASQISPKSSVCRAEIIITDKCNFNCLYCRGLEEKFKGDIDYHTFFYTFINQIGLKNIRFSGGEPTLHPNLMKFVEIAKKFNVERIAISTNGSASLKFYKELIDAGVNDFSISLDACCANDFCKMSGIENIRQQFGKSKYHWLSVVSKWKRIINNIQELSKLTYVTIGVVFTEENYPNFKDIIKFAHSLGPADIRIIPAAQSNILLNQAKYIEKIILTAHPILAYRVNNILNGRYIRGLSNKDTNRCYLVQDDVTIAGSFHFPCIIYLREGGDPIGLVSSKMREERTNWSKKHNTHQDKICWKNCLDVCVDFNNKCEEYNKVK